MALTPQEVARLAALARLELTESECAELAPELEVILGSVARVGEVAGDDVPLMTHALPLTNVMRPDQVRELIRIVRALLACSWVRVIRVRPGHTPAVPVSGQHSRM